jgi:hypothetical protein
VETGNTAGMTPVLARRLILAGSAAVLLATAVTACDPGRGSDRPDLGVLEPVTVPSVPTSPSSTVLARAERFKDEPEQESERGVFSTVIIDRQLPPDADLEAEVTVHRMPGESKLVPTKAEDGNRVYTITVAGTNVEVDESKANPGGYDRQLQWIVGNTRYVLASGPYTTREEVVYGPTLDDLRWIVERIIRTG